MDTLTHALAGTAVSDGLFRKRLGRMATPFSFLVSALPDIDAVTYFISPESAWVNHRGYTHSLLPMLLASPILGYIGYRASGREDDWRRWSLLALVCLYSHTFIDLLTSWGTMPFLPFSRARVSWDVAPILDVFIFSLLMASFVLNRLLRWERTDTFMNPLAFPVVHKHPKRTRFATIAARVVLALALIYFAVGWRQNRQTVRVAREALAKQGVQAVEVRALPAMFTYIAWQVAARDADGAVYNGVHSSYAPKPIEFTRYGTIPRAEIGDILASPGGRVFSWYSQGMYVADRLDRDEDGVRLTDRRFWMLTEPHLSRFAMDFTRDSTGGWKASRAAQARVSDVSLRDEFKRLWRLTWHGDLKEPAAGNSTKIENDT